MNFKNISPHKAFLKCKFKITRMEEYIRNVFSEQFKKLSMILIGKKIQESIDIKNILKKNEDFDLLREMLNKNVL